MKLKAAGQEVKEVIIAYDALAIIVHPVNPTKTPVPSSLRNPRFTSNFLNYSFRSNSFPRNRRGNEYHHLASILFSNEICVYR